MLAARSAAEVARAKAALAPFSSGRLSSKSGIGDPSSRKRQSKNKNLPKAGALDALQKLLGDDLIGIDIGPIHRGDQAGVFGEWHHDVKDGFKLLDVRRVLSSKRQLNFCTPTPGYRQNARHCRGGGHGGGDQVRAAAFALAAFEVAVAGRWRSARRGRACRGSCARHMLQPASRHSKPASLKTRSRPSLSACCFTCPLPGTTIALTRLRHVVAADDGAAARKSSMRALVQEPMNTRSSVNDRDRLAGLPDPCIRGRWRRLYVRFGC